MSLLAITCGHSMWATDWMSAHATVTGRGKQSHKPAARSGTDTCSAIRLCSLAHVKSLLRVHRGCIYQLIQYIRWLSTVCLWKVECHRVTGDLDITHQKGRCVAAGCISHSGTFEGLLVKPEGVDLATYMMHIGILQQIKGDRMMLNGAADTAVAVYQPMVLEHYQTQH